jgi:predicted phage-related endonuclease
MGADTPISATAPITWSRFERKSVDTGALRKRFPEVWEACLRVTSSERFTVRGAAQEDDD